MALLVGLFGGLGLIFLVEYLDNTVKGPEDVEKLAGLPSLGIIPFLSAETPQERSRRSTAPTAPTGPEDAKPGEPLPEVREIELINHLYPKFSIAEDYRTVRTSILFSHADSAPKTIAFTSTLPQEGKSATISNLAVSFAQLEGKVLLIDADLRKPRLSKIFNLRNTTGLSSYLAGKNGFDEVVQKTSIDNVWTIPSGPASAQPGRASELEADEGAPGPGQGPLQRRPPRHAARSWPSSTRSSSARSPTRRSSSSGPGKTTRRSLLRAVEEVRKSKADIIGVVFNEVRIGRQGIGTPFYHYYQYEYTRPSPAADGRPARPGRSDPGRHGKS